MPFIADQPAPKSGGFVADTPTGDQPTGPQGPFRYLSATGQTTASPTAYDPGKDPFASQGVMQNLVRNLPSSPAMPLAGAIAMPGNPLAGQMIGGAVGGGLEAARRGGNIPLGAALEASIIGLLGVAGGAVGKGLGYRAYTFEYAQGKLKEAAEAVRDRVPQALKFFELPSLSKSKMTFDEAVEKLSKARMQDFKDGLKEFVAQLDTLELKEPVGRAASAGGAFAARAPEYLRDPGEFSQLAHSLAGDPTGRLLLGIPGLGVAAAGKGIGTHALKWLGEKILP